MPKALPSQSLLREKLHYCPETGSLTWLKPTKGSGRKVGQEFGSLTSTVSSGATKVYRMGMFLGTTYYAHRLIWVWMTDDDPGVKFVDHEDRDGLNNRWSNLRLLDRPDNIVNQDRPRTPDSPYKGVYRRGKRWIGQVRRNKKLYNTKTVDTPEEARDLLAAINFES